MQKIHFIFLFCFLLLFVTHVLSQNVGVGTASPLEKLHVAGNIKADTMKPGAIKLTPNAGIDKILTSDASGNASWQSNSRVAGNIGYGMWGDCTTNGNISEYQPMADTGAVNNDAFGFTVSVSGNYAIVGIQGDDIGANADQGSANIYQFDGTGWVLMQKITDPTGAASDLFGATVSISGNYAVVGAPGDDLAANADEGSICIYQFNGTNWVFTQKITDATGAAGDLFGLNVFVSDSYVIAGAPSDDIGANANQGSVSIFQYNGTNWVLMQKITDATGAAGDDFGISVFISGNYAIAGSDLDDVGANANQGSASIYRYNGTSWVLMQKITDATGIFNEGFGSDVSISGNYAMVAGSNDNVGSNTSQGSVSIYKYNGTSWVLMQKLADPNGATSDNFGSSVFISGNYALVGTIGDDVGTNTNQGSVIIYQLVGMGWQRLQYITDPGGMATDYFGSAVSIDGATKRFIIGAYDYAQSSGKVLFGKIN